MQYGTVAAHVFQVRHVEHLSSGIFVYKSDILGVIFLSSTPWPVLENDADITTVLYVHEKGEIVKK
jgi:hypothetical protein